MKNPGAPQLVQMNNEALELMERQDVSSAEIDPSIVMFATNPVGDVQSAAADAMVGEVRLPVDIYNGEATEEDAGERAEAAELGRGVLDTADRIARPARRRDVALASLLGFVLGAGALVGVAKIKDEIQSTPGDGLKSAINGDRVFSGTTLVNDSSIVPGDTAGRIPVVGPILKKIPGVPDFGSVYIRIPTTVKHTTEKKHVVLSDAYRSTNVVNPVSPDLQPTGKEYGLGRRAARKLFGKIMPGKFKVDRLTVTGEVSDEYGGVLGQPNPEQEQLAMDRARIATKAVKDEARAEGIKIPTNIGIEGREAVLTPRQIKRVDRAAAEMNISTSKLLSLYDAGEVQNGRAKKLLDRYLGDHRGGKISIEGTRKKVEEYKITKRVTVNKDKLFPDNIPGEIFIGAGLFVGLLYGSVLTWARSHNRYIAKRSKKMAQDKGLVL